MEPWNWMHMFLSFKISCFVNLWPDRYIESQVLYLWIGKNLLSDLWICRSDRFCKCWTARWRGWMGCQAVEVTDMWLPTDCTRKPFGAANEIPRSENSRLVVIALNICAISPLKTKRNLFCKLQSWWTKSS